MTSLHLFIHPLVCSFIFSFINYIVNNGIIIFIVVVVVVNII